MTAREWEAFEKYNESMEENLKILEQKINRLEKLIDDYRLKLIAERRMQNE